MAFTDAENARIVAIEKLINKLQIAVKNLASQRQLRNLASLRQRDIDDLLTRVTTLETQIENLTNAL